LKLRLFICFILIVTMIACDRNNVVHEPESLQTLHTQVAIDPPENLSESDEVTLLTLDEKEDTFLNRFYATWMNKELRNSVLEIQEGGVLLSGYYYSELGSRANFTVDDINEDEQSIVIHGEEEVISWEEGKPNTIRELKGTLYLKDDGNELIFIRDFSDRLRESRWVRDGVFNEEVAAALVDLIKSRLDEETVDKSILISDGLDEEGQYLITHSNTATKEVIERYHINPHTNVIMCEIMNDYCLWPDNS